MSNEKTSIFERLQNARVELSKLPLTKGGKNTYAKYSYFELTDFLTQSDKVLHEQGLTPVYNFDGTTATLTLFDWFGSEPIVFSTPSADATTFNRDGKPSNLEIQTLGSQHTYLKRYLYMHMMNIAENDSLEPNTGNDEFTPGNANKKSTKKETNEKPPMEETKTIELATMEQIKDLQLLYGNDRLPGLLTYAGNQMGVTYKTIEELPSSITQQLIDLETEKQNAKTKQSIDDI